jgi:hypothetical protein
MRAGDGAKMRAAAVLALALGLGCGAPAARACAVAEPFAVADIAAWPVVVVGEVTAYRRTPTNEGAFTLVVSEVLKGAALDRAEVIWPLHMAEFPPDAWDRPAQVVAALLPPESGATYLLAVEMCGMAQLAEATAENLAAVRAALAP